MNIRESSDKTTNEYRNTKKSIKRHKKNVIKNNSIKDSEIKIRVNSEQKKLLQDKAKKLDMTLTDYILTPHKKDAVELLQLVSDAVVTWNTLNELSHAMKSTPDEKMIEEINSILNTHMPKNNQHLGGTYDDADN